MRGSLREGKLTQMSPHRTRLAAKSDALAICEILNDYIVHSRATLQTEPQIDAEQES